MPLSSNLNVLSKEIILVQSISSHEWAYKFTYKNLHLFLAEQYSQHCINAINQGALKVRRKIRILII